MTRARVLGWGWLAAALLSASLLANACGLSPVEDLPPAGNPGAGGSSSSTGGGMGVEPGTGGQASGAGGASSGDGGSGGADGGAAGQGGGP